MPEDGRRDSDSFAARLDALFRSKRKPDEPDRGYSVREVAAALGWSHTHLGNLRSGRAGDPRISEMQALATFFGVPLSYFTDDPSGDEADVQTRLLRALADPSIQAVALRMADADLSEEGAATVLAMIEQVQRLERAARQRTPRKH